jgi:hypothetical protein
MKTIKSIIVDRTKLHDKNIFDKNYTDDINEVEMPIEFLPNEDDISTAPFLGQKMPFYYNILPRKGREALYDKVFCGAECLFWDTIHFYDKHIGERYYLILVSECPRYGSWNIHDYHNLMNRCVDVKNSKSHEKMGNVKAVYLNKLHKIWGMALFFLYDKMDKTPVSLTKIEFMNKIYNNAKIAGKFLISYHDILFGSDDGKDIKFDQLELMIKQEEKRLVDYCKDNNFLLKYIQKGTKFLFFDELLDMKVNKQLILREKFSLDGLKKHLFKIMMEYKYCEIYKMKSVDIINTLTIEHKISEVEIQRIIKYDTEKRDLSKYLYNLKKKKYKLEIEMDINNGIDLFMSKYDLQKSPTFMDDEIKSFKGSKNALNRLKKTHMQHRKKIALNFLNYLVSNNFTTIEDTYIVLNSQIYSHYVINGDPFYQSGNWFHSIKEFESFMISLKYGVGIKSNDESQVDYFYIKTSKLIMSKKFLDACNLHKRNVEKIFGPGAFIKPYLDEFLTFETDLFNRIHGFSKKSNKGKGKKKKKGKRKKKK